MDSRGYRCSTPILDTDYVIGLVLSAFVIFNRLWKGISGGMLIGFDNPSNNEPEIIIPDQANAIFRTAGLNAWSAWGQLIAATTQDQILAQIAFTHSMPETGNIHVQIGTGAAGSEVSIEEFSISFNIAGAGSTPILGHSFHASWIKIVSGTRLSYRVYSETAANVAICGMFLHMLNLPIGNWHAWNDDYPNGIRATSLLRTPVVPNYITLLNTGAYVDVLNTAANDKLFWGIQHKGDNVFQGIVGVAIGAAGSEVLQSRVAFPGVSGVLRNTGLMQPARKIFVASGNVVRANLIRFSSSADFAFFFEDI